MMVQSMWRTWMNYQPQLVRQIDATSICASKHGYSQCKNSHLSSHLKRTLCVFLARIVRSVLFVRFCILTSKIIISLASNGIIKIEPIQPFAAVASNLSQRLVFSADGKGGNLRRIALFFFLRGIQVGGNMKDLTKFHRFFWAIWIWGLGVFWISQYCRIHFWYADDAPNGNFWSLENHRGENRIRIKFTVHRIEEFAECG